MTKDLDKLEGLDPSDSMETIMGSVENVLSNIENDVDNKEAGKALSLIAKKEEQAREYYMRPFDSDDIYNRLVAVHTSRGEHKEAEGYKRCLDLRQARKWTILGDSYSLMGLNTKAVKYLKRALFFGPSEDLVEEVRNTLEKAEKKVRKAEENSDKIVEKVGSDPGHKNNLIKAVTYLIELNRFDEARKVLSSAPKELRRDPDVLYRKGCIHFGEDDFDKARDIFRSVLEEKPNSTNAKRALNLSEEMLSD